MTLVAFSDTHLGYTKSNKAALVQFLDKLDEKRVDTLVLLGDIFEFWRRNNIEVLTENAHIIEKINNLDIRDIRYVVGNHDLMIYDIAQRFADEYSLKVSKNLRLAYGHDHYYFTHGYDLDCYATMESLPLETYEAFSAAMCRADNTLGGAASLLWDLSTISLSNLTRKARKMQAVPHERDDITKVYQFAVSSAVPFVTGMHPGDRLVFGHTHRPFINHASTVANTGSWCTETGCTYNNTYVVIKNGQMTLRRFDPKATDLF